MLLAISELPNNGQRWPAQSNVMDASAGAAIRIPKNRTTALPIAWPMPIAKPARGLTVCAAGS